MQKPQPKNLDLSLTKCPRAWNDINFINSHRKLQPADTRHNHRHPREETETQRWQRKILCSKKTTTTRTVTTTGSSLNSSTGGGQWKKSTSDQKTPYWTDVITSRAFRCWHWWRTGQPPPINIATIWRRWQERGARSDWLRPPAGPWRMPVWKFPSSCTVHTHCESPTTGATEGRALPAELKSFPLFFPLGLSVTTRGNIWPPSDLSSGFRSGWWDRMRLRPEILQRVVQCLWGPERVAAGFHTLVSNGTWNAVTVLRFSPWLFWLA